MSSTISSHENDTEKVAKSKRSRGGLYLAAGFLFLILGALAASMPGGFWPIFLISFVFNMVGLIVARGWVRRLLAVTLCGLSGGLCAQDFLIWLAQP